MHKLWLVVIVVKEYLYQEFHFYLPKMKIILFFFFFKMTQFPFQLNFTMTINKAQVQTLDYVRIYICRQIFCHRQLFFFFFFEEINRQLYVALSRAKTAAFFLGQNLVKIAFNIY